MVSTEPGEFATLLRRFRQAAALSQEELGRRANLTAKAIGSLERGERRRPYPTTVRAIADALALGEADRTAMAAAARPGSTTSVPADSLRPEALPRPPTRLVGRDRELAEVVALLRSGSRQLITLTGPGGVGKTRLAWEVAAALHADGGLAPVIADLAPLATDDLVLPTIARAFGLHAASGDLVPAIAAFLTDTGGVLVLDNFEHLLGAAEGVADLLSRCPDLVVLATSRAPLRIRAEQEYPLVPLALPNGSDVNSIAWSPAGELFIDRARAVSLSFALDGDNASQVGSICHRLDGLPLAIELAAAHIRHLDAGQLLGRLDEALSSPRLRDLPERQQTMGATLLWSYRLLTAPEQHLLRVLSVFRGGFDLDAIQAVTTGEDIPVVELLDGLIEQSLVSVLDAVRPGAAPHYRLLEPVRHFAAALMDAATAAEVAQRHADHYATLGRAAHVGLRTSGQRHWLDRLEAFHGNLRTALDTLIETGRLGDAARLGGDTWLYWTLRGHAGEGLQWWERVLDPDVGELDQAGRASAHLALAGIRLATGDIDGVRTHAGAAVADARAISDPELLSEALMLWCMGTVFAGDVSAADEALDELQVLAGSLGDPWAIAHARIVAGQRQLLRKALGESRRALVDAEVIARDAALPFTLATALNMQATLDLQVGDDDAALRHLAEAAALAVEVRTIWPLVYTLPALAGLAARRGDPVLAATLFAAGAATAEASLLTVSFRPDAEAADEQLDTVRRRLTIEEFRRAWARGRSLPAEEVLELIPTISDPVAPR